MASTDYAKELLETGQTWLRGALNEKELAGIEAELSNDGLPGQRIAPTSHLIRLIDDLDIPRPVYADQHFKPVRVVSFDKNPQSNWGVPWHQDRVIAVSEKADIAGFEQWSKKSGVWHCEAPEPLLSAMLFVRIHLDDTDETNGAMQIALGSHTLGLVKAEEAAALAEQHDHAFCIAKRGDVHILNMLTLHRSLPSESTKPRRALRVDYSADELPSPLQWATST